MKISSTKTVWLMILFLLLTSSLFAKKVSLEMASKVAACWFKYHSPGNSFSFNIVKIDSVTENHQAVIYQFILTEGRYIWISADDRHAPVLAYNLDPNHPPPDLLPDACRDLLEQYSQEISKTRKENLKTQSKHPEWSNISKGIFKSTMPDEEVAPMLTATWGQGTGYNKYIPNNNPTGCVAVSMVQVMRFWEYPDKGHGTREFTHDSYGDFSVNFDDYDLKWDMMPLDEPNDRIAKLMFYAGIALQMNWTSSGSFAPPDYIADVLISNFGYNAHRLNINFRDRYASLNDWMKMLKLELLNGRPMVYDGKTPDLSGGHSFNIDGFREDHFHVNWGWDGRYNGYFLLTSLTPGDNDYSLTRVCLTGIFPGDTMMVNRPIKIRLLAGDSKIVLGWDGIPHQGFEHYRIYRDQVEIGQTPRNIYVDETVSSSQKYSYSVSAIYSIDNTEYESLPTSELISPYPVGIVLPYDEDFEDGHTAWTISSSETGFNWGTAKDLGMGDSEDSHFIGINSDLAGEGIIVFDYLISNQVDLSNSEFVTLSFDYVLKKKDSIGNLSLWYRVFERNEWVSFYELEATDSYSDWTNFKCYIPEKAMAPYAQIAFFYTDMGETGFGAGIDNIKIEEIYERGEPEFEVSANQMCMGQELVFTDLSSGTINSYSWDFGPGANPRYADSKGPHIVVYSSAGMKDVKLELNGLDRIEKKELIEIYAGPQASFSYNIDYKTVTFQNTTLEANSFMWSFGDGEESKEENPAHTYELSGYYPVRLIAIGSICNDTTEIWINIQISSKEDLEIKPQISIYPNPSKGIIRIHLNSVPAGLMHLKLYSLKGEVIVTMDIDHFGRDAIMEQDLSEVEPGIFFLTLTSDMVKLIKKVLIR